MLDVVLSSLDEDKASDIASIDLAGKTAIADYMVVANGTSQRHVSSIADHVMRRLKQAGYGQARAEGARQGDWVLIDAGDIIVHVFRPEVRDFYGLEKMWSADLAGEDDRAAG
ncbi:MAG: ribosome silencing factor [Proteobacteria bacterium]|nr:ribosome silencing factor [Pseudomonadota bacterium]MDA1132363.1 ribosome silencing factor [Pseudomonadota bacterium]